jgi:hypothetical protein
MPRGVYDRSLYPRSREYKRNSSPVYTAWLTQRRQQNRAARAIRSAAMVRRDELLAALEERPSDEPTPRSR